MNMKKEKYEYTNWYLEKRKKMKMKINEMIKWQINK